MTELSIEIDLDEEGRTAMYEQLCEEFGEDAVDETLEEQLIQHITQMFDNRDQLKEAQNGNI